MRYISAIHDIMYADQKRGTIDDLPHKQLINIKIVCVINVSL